MNISAFSFPQSLLLERASFQRLLDYEHAADHSLAVFGLVSMHSMRPCVVHVV